MSNRYALPAIKAIEAREAEVTELCSEYRRRGAAGVPCSFLAAYWRLAAATSLLCRRPRRA